MTWLTTPAHARWLEDETDRLLDFGRAVGGPRRLRPAGRGGCRGRRAARAVDHVPHDARVRARRTCSAARARRRSSTTASPRSTGAFHDDEHGGWFAEVERDGTPRDTDKAAYPHAFVILAAVQRDGRRPPGRARPARRGARRLRRSGSGTTTPAWSSSVGPDVHDARRLPRRQRQHAHGRGVPGGGGRHGRPRLAGPGPADRRARRARLRRGQLLAHPRALRRRLGAATSSTTSTPPRTRSGPTARRSATGWSGRG